MAPSVRRQILGWLAWPSLLALSACANGGKRVVSSSWGKPVPEFKPLQQGLADIGTTRLWYWDTGGSGEVVVFLHPGSGSAEFYPYQQETFARAGYRVISYNRRGQSPSEAGNNAAQHYSVDDLIGVMNFLKVSKFHAVGNALGGYIALDAAISHSDRLLSLVLACSMMGIDEPEYQATLSRLRPKSFEALPMELKELGPSYRASNPEGVAEWMRRHNRAGTRLPVRLRSKISWGALAALKTPTLLMTGDADLWIPPSLLKTVADKIPASRMLVVKDSGHGVQWEQPEEFNRALLEFFQSLRL